MAEPAHRHALRPGTSLLEYELESVLGAGGFGITYLARDTHLERHVAIKEYLPLNVAIRDLAGAVVPLTMGHEPDFRLGLRRFLREAQTLARLRHPNVVRVNRYFEARGTAYMVMDYERGQSLQALWKGAVQVDQDRLRALLLPLLDGLQAVHLAGYLHRDIKPGNIFIRADGSPVLLDFGAARQASGLTGNLTSVLTPGYAPLEQYVADGRQGPWTDLYALACVAYRGLVGERPADAVARLKRDPVPAKLAAVQRRASPALRAAIGWALRLDDARRPQSVEAWRRALQGEVPASAPSRVRQAGAATVAGLVVVLGVALLGQREPTAPAQAPLSPPRVVATAPPAIAPPQDAAPLQAPPVITTLEREVSVAKPATPVRPAPAARPARERPQPAPDEEEVDGLKRKAEQFFRANDANHDGRLSREEVRSRMQFVAENFDKVDTDGDDAITLSEFVHARLAARQKAR